jgi:hypothetical protein
MAFGLRISGRIVGKKGILTENSDAATVLIKDQSFDWGLLRLNQQMVENLNELIRIKHLSITVTSIFKKLQDG